MQLETKSLEFGEFLLDLKEKALLRNGERVPINPKTFKLLVTLIENHGHLVEKDQLMKELWADSFVEEANLAFTVSLLRKILGDDAQRPRFIETVPRRGYRFIAEVRDLDESPDQVLNVSVADVIAPQQKPYALISIAAIVFVSIFSIAFVWVGGNIFSKAKQPKFTRLTTSGKVTNLAVVPDGKQVVFSQTEGAGESLWLRQIDSGSQTQILPPQDGEFVSLTVSPDGRFAYYTFFAENSAVQTLSRVDIAGGTPEQIAGVETDVSVSFSPDGKKFAFTESHKSLKTTELKIADTDGTNQRVLVKAVGENRLFPFFRASPVAWSPDGDAIACVVKESDGNGSFYRILLVNVESGKEEYLSERSWTQIESVVWKDAENLAFIEFEPNSPTRRIWQISRISGEVRQLTDDLNGYEWLGSANGKLFSLQETFYSSLHVSEFAENGNTSPPKQIFGESGRIESLGWSRDEKIFFNSSESGKNEIWQISADGTGPRQLTRDSNLFLTFTVSPVDDSFVFSSVQNGKVSLAAADSDGQNVHQITDGPYEILPSFAPSGETVVFQSGTAPESLWSISLGDKPVPRQLTGYHSTHPLVSPDGMQIAFHFMDYGGQKPSWKLGLIDSENSRFLNKLEFPIPIAERNMAWHPKSSFLTMAFRSGETSDILLWSVADGSVRPLHIEGSGVISALAWSLDGSRLVFSQIFKKSDIVSLNGL